jgi:hypothetical protein
MRGNLRRGASARTRINRNDFGLTFNAPLEGGGFLLSEEVDVEIDLQMIRPAAQNVAHASACHLAPPPGAVRRLW